MRKKTYCILLVFLLALTVHSFSAFAEKVHTAEQEEQERTQQSMSSSDGSAQTHEQIEAAEKALLGKEAYETLEVGHRLEETNSIHFWSIISVVVLLLISTALYFVKKRKTRV